MNWTAIIIWLFAIIWCYSRQDVHQDRPSVRTGRAVPAGPGGRGPDARPAVHHPGGRPAAAVSLRIVTMPIQSQGIITQDNVSVDISAVAYYRVVDAVKSVVAIENVAAAINQIAQTTLRKVVGRHSLDQTLSETEQITPTSGRSWTP